MTEKIDYEKLIKEALKVRENAYCEYSGFAVGAALLATNGTVFTGCNVENSCGTANCAERTAFFKAISEGERQFDVIAIVGGHVDEEITDFCYPCGICRQVMAEFCNDDFRIICAKNENEYEVYTLGEMLPFSFSM